MCDVHRLKGWPLSKVCPAFAPRMEEVRKKQKKEEKKKGGGGGGGGGAPVVKQRKDLVVSTGGALPVTAAFHAAASCTPDPDSHRVAPLA